MWESLLTQGVKEEYGKGNVIYKKGDKKEGLYFLVLGEVKMSIVNTEGNEKLVTLLRTGDIFGEVSMLAGDECFCTATALGKVEVLWLGISTVKNYADKHPEIYWTLLKNISKKIRFIQRQIENDFCSNSIEKVARALLTLAMNNIVLVSQEDIANSVNLSRVTINKILKEFQRENALKVKRNKTTIINIDKIKFFAKK